MLPSPPGGGCGLTRKQVDEVLRQLREEYRTVVQKISDLESDMTDHRLVLEALTPLDGGRRCVCRVSAPASRC